MPRKQKENSLGSLVNELNSAEVIVEETLEEPAAKPKKKITSEEVERKREELIKLASNGEISKTPAQVGKASAKMIDKLYDEWEAFRADRANSFLCDILISKFSSILGGLDAIEKPEEMERELIQDPLLREDIGRVVAIITPWIPFLGVLSGGMTVGKHVFNHHKAGDGFARGPFGGEKTPEERTEEENENGYDTVN